VPRLDERELPGYHDHVMMVTHTGKAGWGQVVDVAPPFVILKGSPHHLCTWCKLWDITIRTRTFPELEQELSRCKHHVLGENKRAAIFCRRCGLILFGS
jgi:hypothetical protein